MPALRNDRSQNPLNLMAAWRRHIVSAVQPAKGQMILNIAAANEALAKELGRSGADVVVVVGSQSTLSVPDGAKTKADSEIKYVVSPVTDLPFGERTFDAVVVAFGLKNLEVEEVSGLFAEAYRVTKEGGRIVVCDYSEPSIAPVGVVAGLATGHRKIRHNTNVKVNTNRKPAQLNQLALARVLQQTGWRYIEYRDMTLGVVALHRGYRQA